tara:strand:+ start:157 stop:288 length:132 start_codon:yes stop_codon:yes gene_type:complete
MSNKLGHIFLIFLWVLVGLLIIDILWGVEDLIDFFIGILNEII